MKSKIDELCTLTSFDELRSLVFAKWATPSHTQITSIDYTFDLNSIPKNLKEDTLLEHTNVTLIPLGSGYRDYIKKALERWRQDCGEKIAFNYVEKLDTDKTGITLIACDKLDRANGLAAYNLKIGSNGEINFDRVMVCLPATVTRALDIKTIYHEIGHALGLNHVHETESVKQRLMTTEQGLGCSVMGYNFVLQSTDNNCTTPQYCLNETYAVYPGPLDKQICTALYQSTPPYSQAKYFHASFSGFANGAMDNAIPTFLSNISFLDIGQTQNDYISRIITIMLRSYIQNSGMTLANAFTVMELAAQNRQHFEFIQLFKIIASITGLFIYLYELYANEDALMTGIYLSAFLISNYCGLTFGQSIGLNTARVSNTVVNNVSSLFNYGASAIQYILPKACETQGSIKFMLFGNKKDQQETIELEETSSMSFLPGKTLI